MAGVFRRAKKNHAHVGGEGDRHAQGWEGHRVGPRLRNWRKRTDGSCRQFENEANPAYHASTTGPEILRDFADKKLDYFVTGYGTGGTFQGVAARQSPTGYQGCVARTGAAALVTSGVRRNASPRARRAIRTRFAAHPVQGWTPDFIPLVLENGLNMNLYDDLVKVEGSDAVKTAQALAETRAFTGISGGANSRRAQGG